MNQEEAFSPERNITVKAPLRVKLLGKYWEANDPNILLAQLEQESANQRRAKREEKNKQFPGPDLEALGHHKELRRFNWLIQIYSQILTRHSPTGVLLDEAGMQMKFLLSLIKSENTWQVRLHNPDLYKDKTQYYYQYNPDESIEQGLQIDVSDETFPRLVSAGEVSHQRYGGVILSKAQRFSELFTARDVKAQGQGVVEVIEEALLTAIRNEQIYIDYAKKVHAKMQLLKSLMQKAGKRKINFRQEDLDQSIEFGFFNDPPRASILTRMNNALLQRYDVIIYPSGRFTFCDYSVKADGREPEGNFSWHTLHWDKIFSLEDMKSGRAGYIERLLDVAIKSVGEEEK